MFLTCRVHLFIDRGTLCEKVNNYFQQIFEHIRINVFVMILHRQWGEEVCKYQFRRVFRERKRLGQITFETNKYESWEREQNRACLMFHHSEDLNVVTTPIVTEPALETSPYNSKLGCKIHLLHQIRITSLSDTFFCFSFFCSVLFCPVSQVKILNINIFAWSEDYSFSQNSKKLEKWKNLGRTYFYDLLSVPPWFTLCSSCSWWRTY